MNNEKKGLTQQDARPIRVTYRQLYRSAWEEVAEFKDWIAPVADKPYKAYCKFCERELHTHRLSLLKHCSSLKHEVRLKEFQQCVTQEVVPLGSKLTEPIIPPSTSDKPVHNYSIKYTSCRSSSKSSVSKKILTTNQARLANKRPRTPSPAASNSSDKSDFMQKDFHVEDENWIDNENENSNEEDHQPHYNADREDDYCTSFSEPDALPTPAPISSQLQNCIDSAPITTHVIDTSRGKPATGVKVSLHKLVDSLWTIVSESVADSDGRCSDLLSRSAFTVGRYKLHFEVGNYFKELQIASLYPFIEIVFDCSNDENDHYHIPLLLNPFGYSTYRGT